MEKAKYVKTVEGFAFYKLRDAKDLDRKLIRDALAESGAKHLVFDFKAFAPKKGYIDIKMDKGLSLRLGYYAARKDIRVPAGFKPKPGLELMKVSAKDFPAFRKFSDSMLEKHYRGPIKEHISREFTRSSKKFSATRLKDCDNAFLTWNGARAGLVSSIDWKLQGSKLGTLVGWAFIDPKLSPALRENAKQLMVKWLLANGRGRFGSAEHAKSHWTQKFFSSIGFKPQRYIVETL